VRIENAGTEMRGSEAEASGALIRSQSDEGLVLIDTSMPTTTGHSELTRIVMLELKDNLVTLSRQCVVVELFSLKRLLVSDFHVWARAMHGASHDTPQPETNASLISHVHAFIFWKLRTMCK
jgi:hypothetical protein